MDTRLIALDARKRTRVVEKLCQRESRAKQPRPIQVAKNSADFGESADLLNQLELLCRRLPLRAVVDEAVHPSPELFVEGFAKVALPPKVKRQIGIEMRKDDIRERAYHIAIQLKGDLFRADLVLTLSGEVAVCVDPRFGAWLFGVGICEDEKRATGVLSRNFGDQARVFRNRLRVFGVYGKINQ